ncbi:MAG: ribonuclease HII [Ignavibacteriales bacterium]|nr:ribonuclease HII [Ignavibacteriales bacterium]
MDLVQFDNSFRSDGISLVCGTDEAGRGPLAGPVAAAAVVYGGDEIIAGVNDSKKLNAENRAYLFAQIKKNARAWAYDLQSPESIDEINILQASLLAMKNAVEKLDYPPHIILIDGNKVFRTNLSVKAIVKGDARSFAIASASIIAKVIRDRIMMELHEEFPVYGWNRNKAYPTKEHIRAVLKYGPCKYHRKSFLKNIDVWRQTDLFESNGKKNG